MDVTRTTETDLDYEAEAHIEDYWVNEVSGGDVAVILPARELSASGEAS